MPEFGSHRWQRTPPTETKGRVHTSLIIVAVLDISKKEKVQINPLEIKLVITNGTGAGGQKRNRTYSCVTVKHIPTGFSIRCDETRSQTKNKQIALEELQKRLQNLYDSNKQEKTRKLRKSQIGSGSRGEKIRTYNVKANRVTDHVSGKKTSLDQIYRGNLNLLR